MTKDNRNSKRMNCNQLVRQFLIVLSPQFCLPDPMVHCSIRHVKRLGCKKELLLSFRLPLHAILSQRTTRLSTPLVNTSLMSSLRLMKHLILSSMKTIIATKGSQSLILRQWQNLQKLTSRQLSAMERVSNKVSKR
jgi:hypothetical protein